MTEKYDKKYFKNISKDVGIIYKKHRPTKNFWTIFIRKYKSSGRLLDIGCGQGFFLEYAEKYYETYGMDISKYAIKDARNKTYTTKYILMDVTKLGFKDNSFDIITCFDVLEHLKNPKSTLQDIYRMLRRKGILAMTVPNLNSIGLKLKQERWFGYRDTTHISLLTNKEWLIMLEKCGFNIIKVFYDGLWDSPYFNYIPSFIQHLIFKIPSTILLSIGIKFPQKYGENLCVIAKKIAKK